MTTNDTPFPRRTFLAGTAALGAMALVRPAVALGDPIADKQAEADAAYAALNAMQDTLDRISDEYTQAILDQQEAQEKMDEAQAQIDEATGRISSLQNHLGNSVRSTYRTGTGSFLEVVLGATTFEEFAIGLDMLNDISEDKAATVVQIKEQRVTLESAKAEYAEQEQIAAEKAEEAYAAKEEAEATVAQYRRTYDSLSAEVAELVEQKRLAEEAAAAAAAAAVVAASAAEGAAEEAHAAENGGNDDDSGNGGGDNGGGNDGGGAHAGNVDDNNDGGNSGGGRDDDDDDDGDSGSSPSGGHKYEGGSTIVDRAYSCIGAPYVWGAVGPSSYDCSGLVSYCVTGSHVRAYTSSSLMGYSAVSNPRPGDVCVRSGHCGIYIGGGQMIHAPHTGATVCVASVQGGMKIVRP